jgi:hypothetical protein
VHLELTILTTYSGVVVTNRHSAYPGSHTLQQPGMPGQSVAEVAQERAEGVGEQAAAKTNAVAQEAEARSNAVTYEAGSETNATAAEAQQRSNAVAEKATGGFGRGSNGWLNAVAEEAMGLCCYRCVLSLVMVGVGVGGINHPVWASQNLRVLNSSYILLLVTASGCWHMVVADENQEVVL